MRIDAHQHFWNFDPVRDAWIDDSMESIRRNFLPEDLTSVLGQNSIDGCVAVQADQSEKETKFLLDLASQHDFIKGVVGWVDLQFDGVEETFATLTQDKNFKGVRHIVQAEPEGFMKGSGFRNGISSLSQFDLTYDILITAGQLKESIALVEQFPEQKFVVDHLAKPSIKTGEIKGWTADMEILAQAQNVHCKVSGMITEADWHSWKYHDLEPYLDVVFGAFGTDRIMFGSDWPVCLLAGEYQEVLGVIDQYLKHYPKEAQDKVFGLNATNFYSLKENP